MVLRSVWLQDFRNHQDRVVELDPELTVIVGRNGSGKTNILEAVYLLSTGESRRVGRQEEMVNWEKEVGRVKGRMEIENGKLKMENEGSQKSETRDQGRDNHGSEFKLAHKESEQGNTAAPATLLEVMVSRGVVQGQKVPVKQYLVNNVKRQKRKFAGNFQVVWFGPEDLDLVAGSPSGRRRFMDDVLRKVDWRYDQALRNYEQGLKRRNNVLEDIREGKIGRDQLVFWDKLLVENGVIVQKRRRELVEWLNQRSEIGDQKLELRRENYELSERQDGSTALQDYGAIIDMADSARLLFQISYDMSEMSYERLREYARQEVAAGRTLVGPHRDDLLIRYKDEMKKGMIGGDWQDLRMYGSRGQQRMGVLWMKMGELSFVEMVLDEKPLLLLDDILSELDLVNDKVVKQLIVGRQTVITTADEWSGRGKAISLQELSGD